MADDPPMRSLDIAAGPAIPPIVTSSVDIMAPAFIIFQKRGEERKEAAPVVGAFIVTNELASAESTVRALDNVPTPPLNPAVTAAAAINCPSWAPVLVVDFAQSEESLRHQTAADVVALNRRGAGEAWTLDTAIPNTVT